MSLKDKISTICKSIYGADGVEFDEVVEKRLESYTNAGYGHLPICMAKTQYSLSTDPAKKSSDWIHCDDKRRSRCCRRWICVSYLWRYHDHSRIAHPPRFL